jgi:hypothetical protein
MFSANAYRIRFATADDADTLRRLAERGSQEPLVGRVLIGHPGPRVAHVMSAARVAARRTGTRCCRRTT